MAIPTVLIDALHAVPVKYMDDLCLKCKISVGTERLTGKGLIRILQEGDVSKLRVVYTKIAPVLMVGGMAPGVGLAFNLVDAICCFCLGLWIDFVVDIVAISLFEVPGVSGLKGVSKGMLGLCKSVKIDSAVFFKIMERIRVNNTLTEGKIHQVFTILMDQANKAVRIDVKDIYSSLSKQNLFIWTNKVLDKVARECEACLKAPASVTNVGNPWTNASSHLHLW